MMDTHAAEQGVRRPVMRRRSVVTTLLGAALLGMLAGPAVAAPAQPPPAGPACLIPGPPGAPCAVTIDGAPALAREVNRLVRAGRAAAVDARLAAISADPAGWCPDALFGPDDRPPKLIQAAHRYAADVALHARRTERWPAALRCGLVALSTANGDEQAAGALYELARAAQHAPLADPSRPHDRRWGIGPHTLNVDLSPDTGHGEVADLLAAAFLLDPTRARRDALPVKLRSLADRAITDVPAPTPVTLVGTWTEPQAVCRALIAARARAGVRLEPPVKCTFDPRGDGARIAFVYRPSREDDAGDCHGRAYLVMQHGSAWSAAVLGEVTQGGDDPGGFRGVPDLAIGSACWGTVEDMQSVRLHPAHGVPQATPPLTVWSATALDETADHSSGGVPTLEWRELICAGAADAPPRCWTTALTLSANPLRARARDRQVWPMHLLRTITLRRLGLAPDQAGAPLEGAEPAALLPAR